MSIYGPVIKESLKNEEMPSGLTITKEEVHDAGNTTPEQPKHWTFVYFEGDDQNAERIAQLLADSLQEGPWYTNFTTEDKEVYVIFPGKYFHYRAGDQETKDSTQKYAESIGIPEKQLDWDE